MKQYIGVKLLEAEPMTLGEYNKHRGWDMPKDEVGCEDNAGYHVRYTDDYESWSPKHIFENAYQESHPEGYNFEPVDLGEVYPEYQARVNIEFDELFTKSQDLAKFMTSDRHDVLSSEEKLRLGKQLRTMVMYRDILYERIINF